MEEKKVVKVMLDLGVSINSMPYSIYLQLDFQELKAKKYVLHLANGTIKYLKGIVLDLLMHMVKLIVPVDFVMYDIEETPYKDKNHTIIFGRP